MSFLDRVHDQRGSISQPEKDLCGTENSSDMCRHAIDEGGLLQAKTSAVIGVKELHATKELRRMAINLWSESNEVTHAWFFGREMRI